MKHPSHHARLTPDKIAYKLAGSGESLSFSQLDTRSNQGAHALQKLGVAAGDHIAIFMENRLEFLELCWAAQRSGVIFTAISRYLKAEEAGLYRARLRREDLPRIGALRQYLCRHQETGRPPMCNASWSRAASTVSIRGSR